VQQFDSTASLASYRQMGHVKFYCRSIWINSQILLAY